MEQAILNELVNVEINFLREQTRMFMRWRNIEKGQAKEWAAMEMVNTTSSRHPNCLKIPRQQIGQAYSGKTLSIKRKHPTCMAVYCFRLAVPGHRYFDNNGDEEGNNPGITGQRSWRRAAQPILGDAAPWRGVLYIGLP